MHHRAKARDQRVCLGPRRTDDSARVAGGLLQGLRVPGRIVDSGLQRGEHPADGVERGLHAHGEFVNESASRDIACHHEAAPRPVQLLGLPGDGAQPLGKLGGEQGVPQQGSGGIGEVRYELDVRRARTAASRERDAEGAEHLAAVVHRGEHVNVVAPAEFRRLGQRMAPERSRGAGPYRGAHEPVPRPQPHRSLARLGSLAEQPRQAGKRLVERAGGPQPAREARQDLISAWARQEEPVHGHVGAAAHGGESCRGDRHGGQPQGASPVGRPGSQRAEPDGHSQVDAGHVGSEHGQLARPRQSMTERAAATAACQIRHADRPCHRFVRRRGDCRS